MNAERLNKWAELLLDTGKRNNLIHFKDAKTSTAEILSPDFATLFSRAERSAVFEVYDPKTEDEEELFAGTDEPNKAYVSKQDYLERYGKKLKKQQILVYNSINKPIAALRYIGKRAKTAIEETGVNIAYIAFGFMRWTESEDSKQILQAPILLAPITIENESPVEPYYIRVIDDETIVNPTFAFKLQNEYGIKLPEFDEDEGIEAYFEKLEGLVAKLKWSVVEECKIGIFSFLKINMYKDLKDNADRIAKNGSVRALLGEPEPREEGGEGEPSEQHNVVDADSSQTEAVEAAKRGESFVLQGPPGTGKSQTITNIVAECLADGKKVLFVSEKLAALNVVYDKLKKAGLEEFCLELHSHKANKKQVIEELCHTLRLAKSGVSGQAKKELKAKKEAQERLDAYTDELHKLRPVINRTLYGLYEEAAACRFAPTLDFVVSDIREKGEAYIEEAETLLRRYVEYIPSIGYDYRENIFYGYIAPNGDYETVVRLKGDLASVCGLCRELTAAATVARERFGVWIDTVTRARAYQSFFALAGESDFLTPALLNAEIARKTGDAIEKMDSLAKEILSKKAHLDEAYDEDIYKFDGRSLHKRLTINCGGFFARLFGGEYKRIVGELRLCKKDGKKPSYKSAVAAMHDLKIYQQKTQEFAEIEASVSELIGRAYNGVNTDFEKCVSDLKRLEELQAAGLTFGRLGEATKEEYDALRPDFAELAARYEKTLCERAEAEKRLTSCFDREKYDVQNAELQALAEKCEGMLENLEGLDNWCSFRALTERLKALGLLDYIDDAIAMRVNAEQIVAAYKKAFCLQWVDAILHASPVLAELSRVPHDEAVKRFREKDELHFEINKAQIKAELSAKRPAADMVAQGSSIAVLLREGEKKRKQKGIRALLSEIGELAQTLKPCFLMSPLSVSTYLSPETSFDVVVFDEASQIFPQDAIGAIYRGKQLIVVGDSKQMPPSNFFNAAAESDSDESEEDVTDFESILDLCAVSFPQRRLKWHYRSRFEQLISFSNRNFYDGELVTFPSSKTDEKGRGVDYIYVDGTFDRTTKTNRAEAEKIVELVFEHIDEYPERSLGVVAFSMSQQNLIDKLIARRRQRDPSKEFFFRSDRAEPFFVKNLETVQGDERDTIVFSVAYAKDAQGKLLLNFGPLNREGGERRLNVAVTRAKYNVKLVSSMHGADIDLARTQSAGARLLREYLGYAENGAEISTQAAEGNSFENTDSPFVGEVCEFLRAQGYAVDTGVGCSAFKIDLAVKRPESDDYVLAIECDGESYRLSKSTRDRDRLRGEILERMGWKFYRVWSTDWFRNKRVEQENLLAALKNALTESSPRKTTKKEKTVSFEEELETKRFEFPLYRTANAFELAKRYAYDAARVARAVIEAEAPISEEWLLKRLVWMFGGREKVTNVVREQFDRLTWDFEKRGILRRNGFFYLAGKEIPMLRVPTEGEPPREIGYICAEELANGLRECLRQNVTAEKSGLFRLLSAQLGFAHIGAAIVKQMEEALALLSDEIEINGETLSLK